MKSKHTALTRIAKRCKPWLKKRRKSRVDDINRSVYDIKDEVEFSYKADRGLTEDIIRKISAEKEEPAWMLEKRLQAIRIYESLDVPPWAPDISELDMDHIDTYIRPKTDMKARGEDLPQNIRDTFDRLGIPEAEKEISCRRRRPVRF